MGYSLERKYFVYLGGDLESNLKGSGQEKYVKNLGNICQKLFIEFYEENMWHETERDGANAGQNAVQEKLKI